jgi:hypothetical protein
MRGRTREGVYDFTKKQSFDTLPLSPSLREGGVETGKFINDLNISLSHHPYI